MNGIRVSDDFKPIKNFRIIEKTIFGTVERNFSFSIFEKKLILGRFSMEVGHSPLINL